MLRLAFILVFCCTTVLPLKSQFYHEVGVGFSGMRIWEVAPPESKSLMQDLDFSWGLNISYQFFFLDEEISVGASVGLLREIGEKENISQGREEYRKDLRNSLIYQITGSANLFRSKKRFFQITTGVWATSTYFFSHYDKVIKVSETGGSSGSWGGFELDNWYDPKFSMLVSIGYQRSLFGKLNNKSSLSWRMTWGFIYQLPAFYGTANGIENRYASIYTGPSLSLIWRIKQKRKRGLF